MPNRRWRDRRYRNSFGYAWGRGNGRWDPKVNKRYRPAY